MLSKKLLWRDYKKVRSDGVIEGVLGRASLRGRSWFNLAQLMQLKTNDFNEVSIT